MTPSPLTRQTIQGAVEAYVLEFAETSGGRIEANVAKPGFITGSGRQIPNVPGLPNIPVADISAALLDQVVNGFEKDTLSNDDMIRIGQNAVTNA